MEKEVLAFKGERNLWIDFTTKVKKERKEIWEVLRVLILKYLKRKK